MEIFENLIIIGTSHIAIESIREVDQIIRDRNPDCVALELDKGRFITLLTKNRKKLSWKDIKHIGIKGYIFAKFGEYAEVKLGRMVGVSPGDEMLRAAQVAAECGAKVALVDQKIDVTLRNFSDRITWKEKFRFIFDVIKGVFKRPEIKFDLKTVPNQKIIKEMIDIMKKRYPNVYRVLVIDRNKYMAKKLKKLIENYSLVIAVVGAGHEKEIIEEIIKLRI